MIALLLLLGALTTINAQEKIVNPEISYLGTPRSYAIAALNVTGGEGYEDYIITGISGLTIGQRVTVPGSEITDAVKRYWKHGLFSRISIKADSIVGDSIYLHIDLALRPRVSEINYTGVKKSEREDLENKIGLLKGGQLTPNHIDRAKLLTRKYFEDKGYKNAEISIRQRDDVANKNQIILDIDIDKKEKMKIHEIIISGNNKLPSSKIKGKLFGKGAFKNMHEANKLSTFLKKKKYTPERWKEDKKNLIESKSGIELFKLFSG